ncbi:MAG: ABC transporter ATP-binding protein [Gammaproteobacteria bacterium]|nr:MAG: ABC transporter ATP-binding protein [Gammaproteobacteria bacterium]
MSLISAQNLRKSYGDTAALNGFDLNVEPGRIVGLIGPNGSGKTTALKSILGLLHLDGGELNVLGLDPYKQRKELMTRTAYIADVGILPRWMRVDHLLDFIEGVHASFDRAIAEAALEKTDVKLNKKIHVLSKGMNVQLHLAITLAIDAKILVLDEPTLGLDILYRQRFYDSVLNDYYQDNRSILITTHEVREIEHILTDVVFIHRGKACLSLTMDDLAKQFCKLTSGQESVQKIRELKPIAERKTLQGSEFIFREANTEELARYGEIATPNLVDLFIAVIGEQQ